MFSNDPKYDLPFDVRACYYLRRDAVRNAPELMNLIEKGKERVSFLSRQVFEAFPEAVVSGLQCYIVDCGCIYYQRKSADGSLGSEAGIYRDKQRWGVWNLHGHRRKLATEGVRVEAGMGQFTQEDF